MQELELRERRTRKNKIHFCTKTCTYRMGQSRRTHVMCDVAPTFAIVAVAADAAAVAVAFVGVQNATGAKLN